MDFARSADGRCPAVDGGAHLRDPQVMVVDRIEILKSTGEADGREDAIPVGLVDGGPQGT
jgi:hypothetical protein